MRFSFYLFFLLISIRGISQPDCQLELKKDSIMVYMCPVSNSKFKSVKSVFTINSKLSQLAALLQDIDFYSEWQYKTVSARLLKQVSDREIIYHTEVEAPVLTNNRDFVIRLTIDPDPMTGGMIVDAVSIPEYLPIVDDVIRVPYSRARWKIVPISPGKLSVEYTIDIDLGGAVPPWLVNLVAPKAPYETFKALREKVGTYHNRSVPFIKD